METSFYFNATNYIFLVLAAYFFGYITLEIYDLKRTVLDIKKFSFLFTIIDLSIFVIDA